MKKYKNFTVAYARKRDKKTNYRKRIKLVVSGEIRVVVRRMINNISVQMVEFNSGGDKTLAGVHSRELLKLGWKGHKGNIPSAYLSGYVCGLKAVKKGVRNAIVDFGMFRSVRGGSLYAAVKGVRDAGVGIKCDEKMFPSEDAICGRLIENYAAGAKGAKYSRSIGEGIVKNFEETKKRIEEKWQR